jgi:hypothetical protein
VLKNRSVLTVRWLVLLAAFAFIGCGVSQRSKTAPAAEELPAKAAIATANWERMRQCADQADRLATRLKWRSDKSSGWGSHYNPERQRCFVVETTFDPAKMTVFEEIYDGFEGVNLGDRLIESLGTKDLICNITAHPWTEPLGRIDCGDYRRFLLDRLEK